MRDATSGRKMLSVCRFDATILFRNLFGDEGQISLALCWRGIVTFAGLSPKTDCLCPCSPHCRSVEHFDFVPLMTFPTQVI